MTTETRPEAPADLAAGGRHVWQAMHDLLDEVEEGLDFDERELELLLAACRLRDRLDELHARVAEDGPVSTGSQGQPVPHPCLAATGALTAQFRLALTSVSVDPDEVARGARSVSGRRGAGRRWAAERRDRDAREAMLRAVT